MGLARLWIAIASLTLVCTSVQAQNSTSGNPAPSKVTVNIEAQSIRGALQDFGKQTGLQVLFRSEDLSVEGLVTLRVTGELTAQEALDRLLAKTGLQYEFVNPHTVRISGPRPISGLKGTGELVNPNSVSGPIEGTKTDGAVSSEAEKNKLDEITVTAQKKSERLQDVPVPVTAMSADALVEQNQLQLQDYYTRIPGLNLTLSRNGDPALSIRGLTTGGGNPTVGIVVDDVPYGSTSSYAGGGPAPDIDPSELERVEVLRGPQGTLYGASSIGGLIKFVTIDPSTDGVSGRIQAGTSSVYNGAELGYNLRGAVNVPLWDTLAIRASGFVRQDPGYIDNVETDQRGVNKGEVDGGRVSALWRPSEVFSLKLSALLQRLQVDGSSNVELQSGLGDLQQRDLRDTGWFEKHVEVYSATATGKLSGVDITAVSGYSVNNFSNSLDLTSIFAPYTQYGVPGTGFNGFGVPGTPYFQHYETDKFTQEIRFSAPVGQRLDWLFGLFYTHENSRTEQHLLAVDPATGTSVGEWLFAEFPTTFTEYAAFTDLTFHLTDRFDVQIGGRESKNRQTYSETDIGPYDAIFLGAPSPAINPDVVTNDNSFTYLVTPRYKVSPDLMVYARVATGYRPGGPNPTSTVFGLPPHFNPDKTQNYEIGVKGDVFDRALSFDASVYYIDWKDIQLSLVEPVSFAQYFANGSRAKSQGVELSVESKPLTGLTIAAWVAWNDAKLTENFPAASAAYGVSGDRLPYSSRISGSLSLDQKFSITSSTTGFVGGTVSYVGDRLGLFTSPPPTVPPRQEYPSYVETDLRAGINYDTWTLNLFVTNVADKRGLLSGGLGTLTPLYFTYIQPRTAGLNVSKTF